MQNQKQHKPDPLIRRMLSIFGLSRAVFFGFMSKVWFAGAGAVTVFLIAAYFSPEVQGYYFTFASLLGLQIFVELGLTAVIINFASHEWSKLKLNERGYIEGDEKALSRLKGLATVSFVWYSVAAIILVLGLAMIGYFFFSLSPQVGISWVAPWFCLCFVTALNLALLPAISLLEGCNQVAKVYFYRFVMEVVRATALWIAIILGLKLWSQFLFSSAVLVWTVIFLLTNYYGFFKKLFSEKVRARLDWRREVWPMQWRIAVSWLSGYFFFWLFTPALFHFKGAAVAGQMGMTWSIVNALSVASSMWIVTRAPELGITIAQKKHKEADRLLFRSAFWAVLIASLGSIAVFAFVLGLNALHYSLALRLLPPLPTAFFLAATILMQISYGQSTYLRAHKQEPFMGLSVISAILMASLVALVVVRWGALGLSISYFGVVALFKIPYGTWVWYRFRKKLRHDIPVDVNYLFAE